MKTEKYEFDRVGVAGAACCSADVVRMEQKKGTFDTCWGLVRWVMAKRLLSGGSMKNPVMKIVGENLADDDGMHYEPDESQEEGRW